MNLKDLTNKQIGKACQFYRMSLGLRQKDVALDLNYTKDNISQFENGRNGSLRVFIWYLDKGLTIDEIVKVGGRLCE